MRITVFGGAGFLGSHVCDKLSEAGHQVCIFDRVESTYLRSDQKMLTGDLLDPNAVWEAVQGADVVFNYAGVADIEQASQKPVDTARYNVLGNVYVLDACREAGVRRFVYASTVYVYSREGGFYRCSKQASEAYIENFYDEYGLEYTILRYGSLYGPRAGLRNGIFRFVYQALKESRIRYYGSPEAMREYIHVEDAAKLTVQILSPEYANQHIVLTGMEKMQISQLFRMIEEVSGTRIEVEYRSSEKHPHYEITPYSYIPKTGMKLVAPYHVDLGQGMLRVVEEVHQTLNQERGEH